jgi:enoyl-CoA hydratase/carnithine racemase
MPTKIIVEKDSGIGQLIFNQPEKRNAISLGMWQAMTTISQQFANDKDVRVVVVRGAGHESFSAGADISEFETNRSSEKETTNYNQTMVSALDALDHINKPTIALIQGYCVGGGASIALHCDIRIADETSRFAIPAAKLGLAYHWEDVQLLTAIVGPAFAREILYTGRQFTSEEAMQMGLINRIVSSTRIADFATSYADEIANNAPLTIKAIKQMVLETLKDSSDRNIPLMNELVDACFNSEDYQEGRLAFTEKRKPSFRGK